MKKIKLFLLTALLPMFFMTAAACGNDDEDSANSGDNSKVAGYWITRNFPGITYAEFLFKTDGTASSGFCQAAGQFFEDSTGSYTFDGKTLKLQTAQGEIIFTLVDDNNMNANYQGATAPVARSTKQTGWETC